MNVSAVNIHLVYIGKPRNADANRLAAEYARRLTRFCRFDMVEVKDEKTASRYPKAVKVVLDPEGPMMTSRGLASFLEKNSGEIAFFVGGADGFSDEFRQGADRLLSLSKMTLPHELARVVLAEQIYRAFTILSGHPYPR